jgi:hypothetical protein
MTSETREASKNPPEKKAYRAPALVTYGRVEEITENLGTNTADGITSSGIA